MRTYVKSEIPRLERSAYRMVRKLRTERVESRCPINDRFESQYLPLRRGMG
jgi:hypothetical protein